jgi:hypothetical protein
MFNRHGAKLTCGLKRYAPMTPPGEWRWARVGAVGNPIAVGCALL